MSASVAQDVGTALLQVNQSPMIHVGTVISAAVMSVSVASYIRFKHVVRTAHGIRQHRGDTANPATGVPTTPTSSAVIDELDRVYVEHLMEACIGLSTVLFVLYLSQSIVIGVNSSTIRTSASGCAQVVYSNVIHPFIIPPILIALLGLYTETYIRLGEITRKLLPKDQVVMFCDPFTPWNIRIQRAELLRPELHKLVLSNIGIVSIMLLGSLIVTWLGILLTGKSLIIMSQELQGCR